MTDAPAWTLASAKRRRQIGLGLLRSLAAAIVLVGLYRLLPLDHLASVPLEVTLVAGPLVLLAVMLLASLLQKRTAKTAPPSPSPSSASA